MAITDLIARVFACTPSNFGVEDMSVQPTLFKGPKNLFYRFVVTTVNLETMISVNWHYFSEGPLSNLPLICSPKF